MDRTQKLEYEKSMEQYFDEHKVYDLIQKLFEELIINKPDNPIDYLINRLKRKSVKRIFIIGSANTKNICSSLSSKLGYETISTSDLLKQEISKQDDTSKNIEKSYNENRLIDDEIVINIIRNQIAKYEDENKSYIIEGFPRNRTQAIFLQSMGILADSIISLTSSPEKVEESVIEKIKSKNENKSDDEIKLLAQTSVNEAEMNINSLKDVFKGFYHEINIDDFENENDAVAHIQKFLLFKEKVNNARCPPKIILITPPGTDKVKIAKLVCNQLRVISVDITELLTKEIGAKNENSKYILESIEKKELTDNKYVLKLLEDRLYCSDCVINGWIVTGFPKTDLQLNYMENMNSEIKPSLIVLIDDEAVENDENKKYDAEAWKNIKEIVLSKNYKNLIKLDGKQSESQYAESIVEKTGFNS